MKKYLLSTWLKISGIVAASGIGYENNQLMLISDNGNALYHYFIGNDSLAKYSFDEQPIMNAMKKKENTIWKPLPLLIIPGMPLVRDLLKKEQLVLCLINFRNTLLLST